MVRVEFVKFGELMVDGKIYYSDMIVWWDGEREFVEKSHILGRDVFSMLLRKKPDMIVVGTGESGILKVSGEVREMSREKGIKIFEDVSSKAVDIFNGLVKDGKRVAALVHTTC